MRWLANQGYLLMVVTSLFWSGNAIIGRGVHEVIPPVGLAFWRWAVTLPIFVALAWPYLKRDLPVLIQHWRWMVFLAALAIAGYNTIVYTGLDYTTAINMVLINSARPAIIVLMSYLFFGVSVRGWQAVGLILGFLGAAVILFRGDVERLVAFELNFGDLWIFVATIVWALYTVFLPKRPPIHPASFMAYSVVIGLVLLLPFYLWEAIAVEAVPLVADTVGAVLFLALFSSVVAYLGYNRVVELLGANVAGTSSYLVMAFGVVLAIVVLGEAFHLFHAAGLALLLAGTYLATRKKAKPL